MAVLEASGAADPTVDRGAMLPDCAGGVGAGLGCAVAGRGAPVQMLVA
jgi:hypothetical protein